MIVYHIDKSGFLVPGQIIKPPLPLLHPESARRERMQTLNRLYDGHLSMFGFQALDDSPGKILPLEMTELILDYVRALHFPDAPSRLTVLYASRSIEGAMRWISSLVLPDCKPQLATLEAFGEVYAANVLLRDAVGNRVAALCEEYRVHPANTPQASSPAMQQVPLATWGSTCLVRCLDAAMAYWQSLYPVYESGGNPLYPDEELLLVPPVRVLEVREP